MKVEYKESFREGRATWHGLELDDAPLAVHNLVEAGMYQLKHQVEALFAIVARMDDIETRVVSLEHAEQVNATIEQRLDSVETKQHNDRKLITGIAGDNVGQAQNAFDLVKAVQMMADDLSEIKSAMKALGQSLDDEGRLSA